jgi:P4 family phage/plasmid primase-like protien
MCGSERIVKEVPKNWIYTLNGVFDISTKQVFEATPEYFFTDPIPHKIGSSMDTPNIDKLFESWVGTEKISLYELCAYCLVDDYPIHRIFSCWGGGGNGKGQFEKIVIKHVGAKNSTSASLRKLISSRFEAAKLYRKKVCIIDETPTAIESTDELKALSGDGMISVEFKNKQGFDINNTAKIVIMTNNVPEVKDKTDAWYRRSFLIKFPNHFGEGKSVVDGIPEAEYENLLMRCLQILPDLLDRGKFTNDLPTIQEKKKSYEQASRPIKLYLDEFCVKEDVEYPTWKMQEEYNTEFAPKKGCRTLSKQAFNDALETEGYELFKKEYTDSNGKRHLNKFVLGIRPIKDATSGIPRIKNLGPVFSINA